MKHITVIIALSLVLVGCGDAGQKALKAAAQSILEEDNKDAQPQPQPQQPSYPQPPQQTDNAPYYPDTEGGGGYVVDNGEGNQQHDAPAYEEPLPPKPAPPAPRAAANTETVVRYRAQVLTQYGGKVLVRQSPSKAGRKLGFLYDQEEVFVVGETSKCEVINRIDGCWVKVRDSQGLVGYSFGGYLQY